MAVRHTGDAQGERDGEDRGQAFGNRGDGEADRRDEHLVHRIATPPHAEHEHADRKQQNRQRQPPAKTRHLLHQRRGQRRHPGEQAVDATQLGRGAGGDYHAGCLAVAHQRARPRHVVAVGERGVGGERLGLLFDRQGFAGQRGLGHAQAVDRDEAQVGGHFVARREVHEVARHQLGGVDLVLLSATGDDGVRRQHRADRVERLLRAALLNETDQCVDDDHAKNHPGVEPVPERQRDATGDQQEVNQHVVKLRQQAFPARRARRLRQAVGTEALAPRRDFDRVQADVGRVEPGLRRDGGERVPARRRIKVGDHGGSGVKVCASRREQAGRLSGYALALNPASASRGFPAGLRRVFRCGPCGSAAGRAALVWRKRRATPGWGRGR